MGPPRLSTRRHHDAPCRRPTPLGRPGRAGPGGGVWAWQACRARGVARREEHAASRACHAASSPPPRPAPSSAPRRAAPRPLPTPAAAAAARMAAATRRRPGRSTGHGAARPVRIEPAVRRPPPSVRLVGGWLAFACADAHWPAHSTENR